MKRILLSLLGCALFLITSAQSKKITIAVNDKVKIDMVLISPDTFIRKNYYGDTLCDYGRLSPVMGKGAYNGYDTIVLAPYYMAKFEVTQQLYVTVMHRNPSHFNDDNNHYGCYGNPELLPVETVSWSDAQAFIDTLNKLTGKLAAKGEGIEELVTHAVHIAKYQEKPGRNDFCSADHKGGAVHRCIHGIMELIKDHATASQIPVRFAATKLIEGDEMVEKALNLSQNEKEMIEHIVLQMEDESGLDRSAAIADMRFSFIKDLCAETVVKPRESKEHTRSQKIDKVLTGKYTAIPCFILIMAAVFFLTFNVIGLFLQQLLETGIDNLTALCDGLLTNLNVNEVLHRLIIDGIFGGVGSVLSFVPIIVVLFFFLSLLEDSGYMARVAFVMDKLLRKIGLSGRSIVPMLIGFGCTVPGVMASRTLPSERDRKMTILLTPFMSCTAKLPVYAFFAAAFFPQSAGVVMIGLYALGVISGILVALVLKHTAFKGSAVPFVMELPNYRMPTAKNVLHLLWDKAKDFLQRAFTVILIASVVVWFLQSFDFSFNLVADSSKSILATISSFISPIFALHGFGNWMIVTALIAGFMAKESVVSTLTVLLGTAAIESVIDPAAAISLLAFCLLYTPCVAAIAAIKRELGAKYAAITVVFQCALAWVISFIVHAIATLFI